MIRLGVCTAAANASALAEAGFDYIEENFTKIARATEEEFSKMAENISKSGIKAEAANCFIPADFALLSSFDGKALRDYLALGFARFASLGGRVVVFGSGKARALPEGMARENAYTKMAELCLGFAEMAESYRLRIAVEPLNRRECAYINEVGDGFEITRRAGFPPALGTHADLYHMDAVGDRVENLARFASRLYHCHIAEPISRTIPKKNEFDPLYRAFFASLRSVGYTGRVSFEGSGFAPEHAAELCQTLRSYL